MIVIGSLPASGVSAGGSVPSEDLCAEAAGSGRELVAMEAEAANIYVFGSVVG